MIYIHYCKRCARFHMRSGHKTRCPICGRKTVEAPIPFTDFVKLSERERENYKVTLMDR
ncbi:MAG: hypothetical protein J6P60_03420 [Lachnospiraceae bacterium]|nr:hypothetical protein [Lachnospiraceae bacterium]